MPGESREQERGEIRLNLSIPLTDFVDTMLLNLIFRADHGIISEHGTAVLYYIVLFCNILRRCTLLYCTQK